MDPIANLKEQLEIAREIQTIWDAAAEGYLGVTDRKTVSDKADRLAELVIALDEWRRKGGFDPYTPVYTLAVKENAE